ncbi:MAG: glycosyl hydrolase [Spirosomataceae bacterium]
MRYLIFLWLCSLTVWAQINPSALNQLKYRHIGPDGNRAIAIAGEPGNPQVTYIGAASGGIFKTEDGGVSWRPIFDDQEVSSIGSLALAPSDPKQVWAGTGETFVIRPAHSLGNGIYKSTDAGKTWKNKGLELTGRIGRVVVHPTNPNIVYACAMGHLYGPQAERGVYRTQDGGTTWERVLFVNDQTGAADLAIDPTNPSILYAAMWQVSINTWGLNSGGAGGGIYRSKDGGTTWEPLNVKGLPGGANTPVGKVAVAVAPSNPKVVYALFEASSPALYRSEDGGESWKLMSNDHSMAERAPYYTRIAVMPDNPNEIFYTCVRFGHSFDGGKTWDPRPGWSAGGDNHDMWFDPINPNRYMVAHDGCASITLNRGKTFQSVVLPIAQMYHVAVDNDVPYHVYGNRQDGYSYMAPSQNLAGGGFPLSLWKSVGGCESGFAKPDPFDSNIVFSGCYDGGLDVYDRRTGHARDVRVWPEAAYGWKPGELRYRWHWNFPLSFSPHTPHRVYVGSQFVHKSDDFGQSWQVISPDLTTNDKSHQQSSGGVAIDNLMTFDGCVLFAIEESPIQKDLIWVGTNDGQVQLSRDGGKNWENLTKNINMPPWGTIANIEPSRFEAGMAYISVDLHQMGDFDPYIFKTTDYGKTWKKISDGIPKSRLSFVHVVKEDPKQKGMLYAGTDNCLYVSPDEGKTWTSLKLNMPPAPVYWLEIQKNFDDLVVATYGRGFWILDDLAAVRSYLSQPPTEAVALLPVRNSYRFQDTENEHTARSFSDGQNVPYGVPLHVFLKDTLAKSLKIKILKDGQPIRTLEVNNKKGINRLFWDLRHEAPEKPKLRTLPPGKNWVTFDKEGTRPLVTWDLDLMMGQLGPKAVPGNYTASIEVDGRTFTQPFALIKDPYSVGTQADIEAQVAFSLKIRDAMNQAVRMINSLEEYRKQIGEILPQLTDKKLLPVAQEFEKQATNLSAQLYDVNLTGAREDAFRNPVQVFERLSALASDIGSNGADFKPTNQQQEVFQLLNERLQQVQTSYDNLLKVNLPKLNSLLQKKNKSLMVQMGGEK